MKKKKFRLIDGFLLAASLSAAAGILYSRGALPPLRKTPPLPSSAPVAGLDVAHLELRWLALDSKFSGMSRSKIPLADWPPLLEEAMALLNEAAALEPRFAGSKTDGPRMINLGRCSLELSGLISRAHELETSPSPALESELRAKTRAYREVRSACLPARGPAGPKRKPGSRRPKRI